jgi:hypothetical protein
VGGNINVSPNVLASIQGGALEIRQSVQFAPLTVTPPGTAGTAGRLRVRHFLVAPGSPNPTPIETQTTVIEDYAVAVDRIITSANPNALTFIGTISETTVSSPFGANRGLPFVYALGYNTSATPAEFTALSLLIPGRLATFVSSATGTLTIEGGTGGPGEPGGNQSPVANAGSDFSTAQSEVLLNGTSSSDPDGDTLTYNWRVVSGAANLINATSATPRVQFSGNFGSYVFELTVTDTEGATATDTITISFTGRF